MRKTMVTYLNVIHLMFQYTYDLSVRLYKSTRLSGIERKKESTLTDLLQLGCFSRY